MEVAPLRRGSPPSLHVIRFGRGPPPPGARAIAVFLAAIVALGGCTLQRPAPAVDWAARSERLLGLEAWDASGRIAVKAGSGSGQGNLVWEQRGPETHIKVNGPFGAGAYDIRWGPGVLTIRSRDGEVSRDYAGPDAAEQFLAGELGWSFPAGSTRYWLLGVPDPAFPARETQGADGRLAALEQNGWAVTYESYAVQSGLPMPAKMTLENPRARVRLAIDRWRF